MMSGDSERVWSNGEVVLLRRAGGGYMLVVTTARAALLSEGDAVALAVALSGRVLIARFTPPGPSEIKAEAPSEDPVKVTGAPTGAGFQRPDGRRPKYAQGPGGRFVSTSTD